MRLGDRFYRLPLHFDAERLALEVGQFTEADWRAHPQGFRGNSALLLISANGEQNDATWGEMRATWQLQRCPYLQQVLMAFETVIGRSRLMRLEPGAEVAEHTDQAYYWRHRLRIHVPIITDPSVAFSCDGQTVRMAPGEAWTFDNWRRHRVVNPSDQPRIHLVIDTCGSAAFWELMERAVRSDDVSTTDRVAPLLVAWRPGVEAAFETERVNATPVMDPSELDLILGELGEDLAETGEAEADAASELRRALWRLRRDWRSVWALYGASREGWPRYRKLIRRCLREAGPAARELRLVSNGTGALQTLEVYLEAALNPKVAGSESRARAATGTGIKRRRILEDPVFIVAAPRSGSTLLFETLARCASIWTIGGEAHAVFEGIAKLNPANRGYDSNRLSAAEADPETARVLKADLVRKLRNDRGLRFLTLPAEAHSGEMRFLEKTPKNALRIPFLDAVFPKARFIFLHRHPRDNISSIMEAWRSGRFVTYPRLPEWEGLPWSLLLPPGWREYHGAPLETIAAFQWASVNRCILEDLDALDSERWCAVSYEAFLADPTCAARRLCEFAGVPFDEGIAAVTRAGLPNARYTLTPPDPDKWQHNAEALATVLPAVEELAARLAALPDVSARGTPAARQTTPRRSLTAR